eukprot:jgi/Psemu1/51209/gm1.51209_g
MSTILRFDLRSHDFHVTLKCLVILISVSSWIYIQSIHRTKPTAPVASENLPIPSHPTIVPSGTTALVHTKPAVSNPIKTISDLLPVQATDSILDTPAPSSNLINPSLHAVKPAEPNAHTTVKVRLPYMTRSFDNTNLNNSNSAGQPVDRQVADTPTANAPMPNKAPHYAWTWTYSPNSESVSFHRVRSRSISFQRATSSSPPIQRQDKPSTVIAPSVLPSALTRFGHHSVPLYVPANFGWTFNPQNEIATFHRLPKPATVPLKPPLRFALSGTITDDPVFSCPLQSQHSDHPFPRCYGTCFEPNHQPVLLRISK